MRKLIQICSILSLVVVFTVISAQAQINKQYSAKIPFDFSIGGKSYQAGDYVIKISKLSLDSTSIALEDKKNVLQTVIVHRNNNVSNNEPKLVFVREGSQRVLSELALQEMGLPNTKSKALKENHKAKETARKSKAKATAKAEGQPETKPQNENLVTK